MSAQWYVGIGASAGGIQALMALARMLPEGVAASYLVVVHVPPHIPSVLPHILERAGRLPAEHGKDGEAIRPGRIYIAPPDHHMLIEAGRIRLDRGPPEKRSRPAIDPLFRSIARSCPERGIGIVLTGNLDDGAAGLAALGAAGGITVVQDPSDALHPAMPRAALAAVRPDHTVPLAELGALLTSLMTDPRTQAEPLQTAPAPPSGGEVKPSSRSGHTDG